MRELKGIDAIVWDIHDLEPANIPVLHSFELTDDTLIHSRALWMPPKHIAIVKKELNKLLKAVVITPTSSVRSFPVVIATKKMVCRVLLLTTAS